MKVLVGGGTGRLIARDMQDTKNSRLKSEQQKI
jgi:hypothetical protein